MNGIKCRLYALIRDCRREQAMDYRVVAISVFILLVWLQACCGAEYEFVTMPETMHPFVQGIPVADLQERYRGGDDEACSLVDAVLERAEAYEGLSDDWWLQRIMHHTPLGMWTTACPFHPERVQDFSDYSWQWSLDEPFRLYCPLCQKEGRKYPYYPNPEYPDDGTGCYPSDEVWKETHSPEWSEEHSGIPWDHWDGSPHGYSGSGYAYFFRGKWHHLAQMRIAKTVLPALGEAYQVAAHVLAEDDPRSEKADYYAHFLKTGLLTIARAHLGDTYLQSVLGHTERQYRDMLEELYNRDDPGQFPGYKPYSLYDGLHGDKEHPPSGNADIYCDGSVFGDAYADGWLRGFALIRDAYTGGAAENDLLHATECVLFAHAADEEQLEGSEEFLKYGKLDYHHRPYSMLGHHNLDGRLLESQFRLGRLFGDDRIIDTVMDNYRYYLDDYAWGDGHGVEGSPAYTNCAWSTMSHFLNTARGYRGSFGPDHPWWNDRVSGLDPYGAQKLCDSLSEAALTVFPNGRQIPWEDSHAAAGPPLGHLRVSVQAGGEIPEYCRDLYEVTGEPGNETVTLNDPATFPSYLLHNNRKVVFRMPHGENTDVLALDYSWLVTHHHYAPMSLIYYALGQEVLTDLGYLGAMNTYTREWIRQSPSHNACLVRNAEGQHTQTRELRGDPTGVMADMGWVCVAEVAEQIPENLSKIGEEAVYSRTVAMVDTGEGSYLLDVFRLRGGRQHEWYLHADGERLSVDGVNLKQSESETLAELFDAPGSSATSLQHVTDLSSGTTDGGFSATWAPLRTWDTGEKTVQKDTGLRCTMLAEPGTRVITGTAPGQRYTDNRDLGARLNLMCVKRDNSSNVDEFVAIHEAYREEPKIESIQRLDAPAGFVAVRVDRGDETDYLVSRIWSATESAQIQVQTPHGLLKCDASFAALTVRGEEVIRAAAIGEGVVSLGVFERKSAPGPRGMLQAFDDAADVLYVRPETDWPKGNALAGQWGLIRHEHGATTFTIDRVSRSENGMVAVHLDYTPHLVLNRLWAKGHHSPARILVEPPPNMPWNRSHPQLGFRVYRRTQEGIKTIGEYTGAGSVPLKDNWGYTLGPPRRTITIEGDTSGVKAGDDLLLTRLRPGEDTVLVPALSSMQATQ